ncbi:arylsulfatase [Pedobacter arcticus]|uniref:arylsulfatase n=1 Tax=Pedobacter arcticus TaxID=752140 RepID=UPI0002D374C9|nr:arylsulfatase [Pedobacter arcticus]
MMKKLFLILFMVFTFCVGFSQTKPNVILIVADDLGYGDIGCYGQKLIETPNIDALAKNGISFTQFYAGTSVCAPSRASLMTGKHTGHTSVQGNFEIKPEGQLPIKDKEFTLAELFKNEGYVTGGFGKWGLGFPGSEGEPNNQGFDSFFGYNCQRQSHNYFPDHLWDNQTEIKLPNTLQNLEVYAPELIQQKSIEFLERNKEAPFFLYLPYTLPHAALQIPAGDTTFTYYKNKFKEAPVAIKNSWNGENYQPQAYPKAAYATMVSKLDSYVGEVVAKVKALNLAENTIIIFTSDNGPHSEGGNDPAKFNSSAGFKGQKRDLYEGGIRVPLIVSWPNKIQANTSTGFMGAFWDFMPTFADVISAPTPSDTDGLSLLPLLTNNGKQAQHPFLYWEFHEDGGRQAVRSGKWKAVKLNVIQHPENPIKLFNLEKDAAEQNDVAKKYPKIVERMTKIMIEQHTENSNFPFITAQ